MAEKLIQHKHCRNCGRAVKVDDDFCNEQCRSEHKEMLRKKRNQLYILLIVAIAIMILAMMAGAY
jgi:predicted nucleic acid-binding Zn ribbon protein